MVDHPRLEEGVRFRATAKGELLAGLFGIVVLELAIAVGWITATGGRLSESWNSVFIALAAAALGFGAAMLIAGHFRNVRARELEADYRALRLRADRMLARVDDF